MINQGDLALKSNLSNVIKNGVWEEGAVRPVWSDGTPAYTKKVFGVVNHYDIDEGLPLITLRKTAWKSALKEALWIYQDKSNDVDLLEEKYNVKYWRDWTNEQGNLGTAYGSRIAQQNKYKEGYFDQIDRLIFDLKNNPYSRRMLTNMYDHNTLHDMTLYPCAFLTMWDYDGEKLNMSLVQRSSDFTVAGAINIMSYIFLQHMVAQATGYKVGKFVHFINNLHIYDRHLNYASELIQKESLGTPKLVIDDSIKNFYDFKPEHFEIENYQHHGTEKLEVAL